ncbi:hypothetical protein niasHT_034035 [Heterodera trifolii]|uniref:Replication factor A C-terminal domain-containing protein n=1 Tax=Heterodera trifolii TaxID=157864 RepID=A0ABD2IL36_9BILA
MSGLTRFQISSTSSKRSAEEFPAHPKQLSEVVKFNSSGTFFVHAKVADLQFSLYKACPLKSSGGVPCKRKLDDEMFCHTCAHRANSPLQCLFLRLGLQDCEDPEINQKVTVFSSVAEDYLAMKVHQFASMVEKCSEKLEVVLQSKLGQTLSVKLNLKAKGGGEFTTMDWIAVAIHEDKQNEVDNEDGEIIELDTGKKRAKKN